MKKRIICKYCEGTGKLGFQKKDCCCCFGKGYYEVEETSGISKDKEWEYEKESSGIDPKGYLK